MRERLLARGAGTLADYEVLEMLLFLGIPRRDTKPLAKAAINRFGDLAAVLDAPDPALAGLGLGGPCARVLGVVREAARRLALADAVEKPQLNTWDRLSAYLDETLVRRPEAGLRLLLLDGRNRLLGDEAVPGGLDDPGLARAAGERALRLHATALIVVDHRPAGGLDYREADVEAVNRLKERAALLAVLLHDVLIAGGGGRVSLKREGML